MKTFTLIVSGFCHLCIAIFGVAIAMYFLYYLGYPNRYGAGRTLLGILLGIGITCEFIYATYVALRPVFRNLNFSLSMGE